MANVYVKRYPGLTINIDAELAWYKVRLDFTDGCVFYDELKSLSAF